MNYERIIPNNIQYHPEGRDQESAEQWLIKDEREESERSYLPPVNEKEFKVMITFLTFNTNWLFIIALATFTMLFLFTYEVIFKGLFTNTAVVWINILCLLINIIDIVTIMIHYYWTDIAAQKVYKRTKKHIIILDIISLLVLVPYSIFQVVNLYYEYILSDIITYIINISILVCILYRIYRTAMYLFRVTNTPERQTLKFVLLKFGSLLVLIIHLGSCIWRCIPILNKKFNGVKNNWIDELDPHIKVDSWSEYCTSILYVVAAVTGLGIGGPALANDWEYLVIIVLMFIGLMFMNGAFLGAYTTVQIETLRRLSTFSRRLILISENLNHPNVPKDLQKSIINYYLLFWHREGALRKSMLFLSLPVSIQEEVHLDKYWNSINQSYLLRNLHVAFKRAVSTEMQTVILNPGETILLQESLKHMMIYVVRGNVDVLSPDDGESPIVTLSVGSCISEMSLVFNYPSPTTLVASSYCVLHCLSKSTFWRIMTKYRKLKQIKSVKNTILTIIESAQIAKARLQQSRKMKVKPLTRVKKMLINLAKAKGKDKRRCAFDIYVIREKELIGQTEDKIFLRTTYPWILHPTSQFILLWEILITFNVIIVSILYPYMVVRMQPASETMKTFIVYTYLFYTLDIIFKIFTAVEDEIGYHTKISKIISTRCTHVEFIIDMFSAIPFYIFIIIIYDTNRALIQAIFHLNHMFKLYKVFQNINLLSNSFNKNVDFLRRLKYIIFLGYAGYICGCIYCIVGSDGWTKRYHGARKENIIQRSMLFAMLILSGTGGKILYTSIIEMSTLILYHILFILLFTYLVADYSATLTLALKNREVFIEMVAAMRKFMNVNNMLPIIKYRMDAYFVSQWDSTQGMSVRYLLQDCPSTLYEQQLSAKYAAAFANIHMFRNMEHEVVVKIAGKCKTLFLPPNEYICYAGALSDEMYIIDNGFCEILSPSSGKVQKVVGPMAHFCDLEMVLTQPRLHNIRTITDVNLIKITMADIQQVVMQYAQMNRELKSVIKDIQESQAARRLFTHTTNVEFEEVTTIAANSFFVFPGRKLHPLNIEFHKSWKGYGVLRFGLRRHTILPYGNFIYQYSIFRAICACIGAAFYLDVYMYQQFVPDYVTIPISVFCTLSAIIDLYIRLHVCYYNEEGILVTHPRCTAKNYLTTSFIVDFIAMIPFDFVFGFLAGLTLSKIMIILNYNRILQMYRVPEAFLYFYRDRLTGQKIIVNLVKYFTFSVILIIFLGSILTLISSDISYVNSKWIVVPASNDTWIINYAKQTLSQEAYSDPSYYLIMCKYYVITHMLQLGFGDTDAQNDVEIYYTIFMILVGYLWFTYILVIISNSKALVNINLTTYQNYMTSLISFMHCEKISKEVQTGTIKHFEYMWQRTHGMKASNILSKCHLALREDCVLYLYERTLAKMPILVDIDRSFYRLLGMHLEEAYFMPDTAIIKLNDIIDTMYIIHRGFVNVLGPDGSIFAVLKQGSAFGHLDNSIHSRSMTTVISWKTVDLLCIKTSTFYNITKTNTLIENRLLKHITFRSLSYIEREFHDISKHAISNIADQVSRKLSKSEKMLYSNHLEVVFMLSCYIACLNQMYQMAFQDYRILFMLIAYLTDLLQLIKIIVGFIKPYQNVLGDVITNRQLIIKRYIRSLQFYIDILGILPLEIFCLVFAKHQLYYLVYLRVNRLVKSWTIKNYFNLTHDYLNARVLSIKLSSVFIYFTLVIHLETCIWYMLGCPNKICSVHSWTYAIDTVNNTHTHISRCGDRYICSLLFSTSITTFTGIGTITARSKLSTGFFIPMSLTIKFMISIFIGNITATVRYFAYTMGNYAHDIRNLRVYLKNGNVSLPLRQRVLSYVGQLWEKSKGKQMPELLVDAPAFITEAIKLEAYGRYIHENYIFSQCHPDFTRLLVSQLQPVTYFTGNTICNHGDINNTMYFMHEGSVEVFQWKEHLDVCVDELRDGDCFGMIQGLFPNTPHSHTFIATRVTIILKLQLEDWIHLLTFYPAAKFEIYDKMSKW